MSHDSVAGNARERSTGFTDEITANHPGVSVVETIYMDQLDEMKRQAAAEQLGVSSEETGGVDSSCSGGRNCCGRCRERRC